MDNRNSGKGTYPITLRSPQAGAPLAAVSSSDVFRVLKKADLLGLAKILDGVSYVDSDYSDPAKTLTPSLPYIGPAPSDRFTISDDGAFTYIGRESLSEVYDAVKAFNYTAGIRQLYLKGIMGFGKSHSGRDGG